MLRQGLRDRNAMLDYLDKKIMELYNGYPLVYLNVDEDLDSRFKMEALALVDQPATEMDWFTFSATPTYEFAAVKLLAYNSS